MAGKLLVSIGMASAVFITQLNAQGDSRFAMNLGGGISTPLNPTGAHAGVSGNILLGAGYNIDRKSSIVGEFLWAGLPPNTFIIRPIEAPTGNVSLYSLTANYRRHMDNIRGSLFGLYFVGGGGWYYRYASIDGKYEVPPATPCLPIFTWWGYACDEGYVYSTKVAYKGSSAGGLNGGMGFTIRLTDSGWKFFTEARYHYAWTERVPTTFIPVTFGIRLH